MDKASKQKSGMTFMQKEVECCHCHEVGHIATNCPKLAKKKEVKMNGFQAPLSERAEERICQWNTLSMNEDLGFQFWSVTQHKSNRSVLDLMQEK